MEHSSFIVSIEIRFKKCFLLLSVIEMILLIKERLS